MEEFLAEIVEYYKTDRITAGLQLSKLPNGKFYCAVHQFPGDITTRTVVAKAVADTLPLAVLNCCSAWRKNEGIKPV